MRKLYLVRHAMPDFEGGIKLCIGNTDIDIGKIGKIESESLKVFFKSKDIKEIFSSPLKRAISTANIISDGKFSIKIEDDLREIYMGSWEGVPLKNIKKSLGDEPDDGEKRVLALERFEKKLIEIMDRAVGDVICVAHAGVNCSFIAKVIGEDIRTSRTIRQPYASYSSFYYESGKFIPLEIGVLPNINNK